MTPPTKVQGAPMRCSASQAAPVSPASVGARRIVAPHRHCSGSTDLLELAEILVRLVAHLRDRVNAHTMTNEVC